MNAARIAAVLALLLAMGCGIACCFVTGTAVIPVATVAAVGFLYFVIIVLVDLFVETL